MNPDQSDPLIASESDDSQSPDRPRSGRIRRFWREWLRPILVVVLICASFRSAVADWHDVPTGSMKPTIMEGDRILVNKLSYDLKVPLIGWRLARWAEPDPGEVVICTSPATGDRLVKRVIGAAGDTVEMRDGRVFVNAKPLAYDRLDSDTIAQLDVDERTGRLFASEQLGDHEHPVMLTPNVKAIRSFNPVVVPDGAVFVMGDNRDRSADSRQFGFVDLATVTGRAWRIAFSLDPDRYYLPRWDRTLRALP